MTSRASRAAVASLLVGAVGSLGLMLYAGRRNPSLILKLLFAVWVLSPFAAAVWARRVITRDAMTVLALVLTAGSVAIYADVAFGHPAAKMGFIFLVVPLASWLLIAVIAGLRYWSRSSPAR